MPPALLQIARQGVARDIRTPVMSPPAPVVRNVEPLAMPAPVVEPLPPGTVPAPVVNPMPPPVVEPMELVAPPTAPPPEMESDTATVAPGTTPTAPPPAVLEDPVDVLLPLASAPAAPPISVPAPLSPMPKVLREPVEWAPAPAPAPALLAPVAPITPAPESVVDPVDYLLPLAPTDDGTSDSWDALLGGPAPVELAEDESSDDTPATLDTATGTSRTARLRAVAAMALVAVAAGIVVAAFHAGNPARTPTAGAAVSTDTTTGERATTTTAPTTTIPPSTTVGVPPAPQPTADGAANALISSWASGNQPRALSVATPGAVATLFANPYHSGSAVDRGCNGAAGSVTCAFGPPGGASPTDPLYSLTVTQAPTGGWYVSEVAVRT